MNIDLKTNPGKLITLKVDPERVLDEGDFATGIFVRAVGPDGKLGSFDIYELDAQSLFDFLRSRGGKNLWAEHIVLLSLGWTYEDIERVKEDEA